MASDSRCRHRGDRHSEMPASRPGRRGRAGAHLFSGGVGLLPGIGGQPRSGDQPASSEAMSVCFIGLRFGTSTRAAPGLSTYTHSTPRVEGLGAKMSSDVHLCFRLELSGRNPGSRKKSILASVFSQKPKQSIADAVDTLGCRWELRHLRRATL
jgi:hypothetical protein